MTTKENFKKQINIIKIWNSKLSLKPFNWHGGWKLDGLDYPKSWKNLQNTYTKILWQEEPYGPVVKGIAPYYNNS